MPSTIMIVQEYSELASFLKNKYTIMGFNVLIANNGEQAIHKLESNDIDFILTDLEMPKMTGLNLLNFLRLNKIEIPVAIMTSSILNFDKIKHLSNIVFVFEKPYIDSQNLIVEYLKIKK